MKVILINDLKGVGKKGEVKEVADGYAQNYLIARKLAVPASKGSMEVLNKQKSDAKEKEALDVQAAKELKEKLEKLTLKFPVKTGKDDKAFGSVSTKQIVSVLENNYKMTVDKRKFIDNENLDTVGFHHVKVQLHKGVIATLKVQLTKAE